MILFGFIEYLQRFQFHLKAVILLLFFFEVPAYFLTECLIPVVYPGLVLGTGILSLPVLHRRIDAEEERLQEDFRRCLCRIIRHTHRFPVAGIIAADVLITGRWRMSVGIACTGGCDTVQQCERLLHAPETASGKVQDLLSLPGVVFIIPDGCQLPVLQA